jgi:hypothetical protein
MNINLYTSFGPSDPQGEQWGLVLCPDQQGQWTGKNKNAPLRAASAPEYHNNWHLSHETCA